MFNKLREDIRYYWEWNRHEFIGYLVVAGVSIGLTATYLALAGAGMDQIAEACKTRCRGR